MDKAAQSSMTPLPFEYRQRLMDARGHAELLPRRTSKSLVGILGDVDGRIVPVAPLPF
jgi:hypothetical protein